MKYPGVVIYMILIVAVTILCNWAYWAALDNIADQTFVTSLFGDILLVPFSVFVMKFTVGIVYSGVLNMYTYKGAYRAAILFTKFIPGVVGIVAIVLFMFRVNYQDHWVMAFITYLFLLVSAQLVLRKICKNSIIYRQTQKLAYEVVSMAQNLVDSIKRGDTTYDKAIESVDYLHVRGAMDTFNRNLIIKFIEEGIRK